MCKDSKFSKGQDVHVVGMGTGIVIEDNNYVCYDGYSISVKFESGRCERFTPLGYHNKNDPEPMLFPLDERPIIRKKVRHEIVRYANVYGDGDISGLHLTLEGAVMGIRPAKKHVATTRLTGSYELVEDSK